MKAPLRTSPGRRGVDDRGPPRRVPGLGSTYRVLGRYEEAVRCLRRGLEEFAGDPALRSFLAMALYNVGPREAVSTLLQILAATSDNPRVQGCRRAIEHYAGDLDAVRGRRAVPLGSVWPLRRIRPGRYGRCRS
ncbi:tetratricopeptide repeat protein [Streptomyces sp. NBC_01207]|uniref:tetratricopeptide repeat protein n=1 Tax=Streptomyces sp. NBC_01207 TaxID=2903772 RepID=UPI002E0F89C0|nr:tetratricopeptide repeat protein [Streptomyces sp. NBC_01207]WTA23210.1 tetratricopeptide repeat protein [Streptomyces sp. NBC_00853]